MPIDVSRKYPPLILPGVVGGPLHGDERRGGHGLVLAGEVDGVAQVEEGAEQALHGHGGAGAVARAEVERGRVAARQRVREEDGRGRRHLHSGARAAAAREQASVARAASWERFGMNRMWTN